MMTGLASQFLALLILMTIVALAWWQWARPHWSELSRQQRGMLMVLLLTFSGGLVGSPFWWLDYRASFSWDLPPLASRLLASAGLAFAVGGAVALRQFRSRLIRLYLLMLLVYLVPLAVVAVTVHLDRFDWTMPITYAFFAIVALLSIPALWHLARGTKVGSDDGEYQAPSLICRMWLLAVTAVFGAWGVALFVTAGGPVAAIWIWPQDALTSRLIAVMLLTIAAGAFVGRSDQRAAAMVLTMSAVYGAGGFGAALWNAVAGKPVLMTYAGALAILAIVSSALMVGYSSSRLQVRPPVAH